jgi:hypothetical protein
MKLTEKEARFLTALAREQNQTGCKGPAHELLRRHAYPGAPLSGPGSLAFPYDTVPLTGLLLESKDLEEIDDFLRKGERVGDPEWPWVSAEEYRSRLEEAREAWKARRASAGGSPGNGAQQRDVSPQVGGNPPVPSGRGPHGD